MMSWSMGMYNGIMGCGVHYEMTTYVHRLYPHTITCIYGYAYVHKSSIQQKLSSKNKSHTKQLM